MAMSNSQAVFTQTLLVARDLFGNKVYDSILPPQGTPYPFVYVAQQDSVQVGVKGAEIMLVNQSIRFYHDNVRERGKLDSMMNDLKMALKNEYKLNGIQIQFISSDQAIVPEDVPQGTKLLHGILTVHFRAVNTNFG